MCLMRARELMAPLPPQVFYRLEWETHRAARGAASVPAPARTSAWRALLQLAPWTRG